ncbi:MAG: ribosome silencing factor [Chloroflexi bacterium]|nr:ribosome silencing factor [Chloroflexota bacterium]MCZ6789075.1 ribosome silencing factor [Chloroflexota bacterium]
MGHYKGGERLEPVEYARKAVDVASEMQAVDILMLDVSDVSSFADYFVILSADNRRQLEALAEDLAQTLKQAGASLHHREGTADSGWVLLDFGDVLLHVFATEAREYYRMDQLWSKGRTVVRIQ